MIVVNRFRIAEAEAEAFRAEAVVALDALAACAGHRGAELGRNVDDPTLWVLVTTWDGVGAYRRALSSYDVKLRAVPVLLRALDEPSAYEVAGPGTVLNEGAARSLG